MARAAFVLVALTCFATSWAQKFNFTAAPFSAGLTEAAQRNQDNYDGFVFDFDKQTLAIPAKDIPPNGRIVANQVNTNPFLSTLPGDGNGQTLVVLGPCASNTPHTHPRGSEISYMLYGSINFGMTEENAGKNIVKGFQIHQNQTIHIPQGILHWSHNPNCQEAAFLANFATKDPGTQTMWESMLAVPTVVLEATTGLPASEILKLQNLPLYVVPTTGGAECLQRCGLNFKTANTERPNVFGQPGVPFQVQYKKFRKL